MKKTRQTLDIIFEDDNYLVLNKPWGIASLDEHVFSTPSMLRLLKAQFPEAQLCHRLDKETSGCLLASKHPDAYRHASILFENKKMEKTYTAIACGVHNFENKEVNLPLLIANKRVRVNKQKGKQALTYFSTIENFKHFTVISCKPVTGRLHQIRVHLYSLNAPIVNDVLYSGSRPFLSQIKRGFKLSKLEEEEEPIITRIALHASRLSFESIDGSTINAEAPMSKELEALLKILRRYD